MNIWMHPQTRQSQNLLILSERLHAAWGPDTSYWPDTWTAENPAHGQCAVTSLIVLELLGGEIVKGEAFMLGGHRWVRHYWNVLEDGTSVDLTAQQFGEAYELREEGTADPDRLRRSIGKRYELLRGRLFLSPAPIMDQI